MSGQAKAFRDACIDSCSWEELASASYPEADMRDWGLTYKEWRWAVDSAAKEIADGEC